MTKKLKWLLFSILGLVLIGAGLSVFGEALVLKMQSEHWQDWFWTGTLSLVLVNSGVSLVGQAVIYKIQHDHYHHWHKHHKASKHIHGEHSDRSEV